VSHMKPSAALFILGLFTLSADARQPPTAVFEAASIKRNNSGQDMAEGGFQPGGRLSATNVTLRNLLVAAFGVPPDRIEGGPAWVNQQRFDVVAVATGNPSVLQMRVMLRKLLEDRFTLVTRMEMRNRPILALTRAREDGRLGSQLRPTSAGCAADVANATDAPPADEPPDPNNPQCGTIGFSGGLLSGRGVRISQMTERSDRFEKSIAPSPTAAACQGSMISSFDGRRRCALPPRRSFLTYPSSLPRSKSNLAFAWRARAVQWMSS